MSPTSPTFGKLLKMLKAPVISLTCAALVTVQDFVSSFTASMAPAAKIVVNSLNPANVGLFDVEAVQLADKVVAELQDNPDAAKYASPFEFGNTNSTAAGHARRVRRALRCKTMPGGYSVYSVKTKNDAQIQLVINLARSQPAPGSP